MTLARNTPLARRTALRPISPARQAKRTAWQAARLAIYGRASGSCERCGHHVHPKAFHAHHRRRRSQGGPDCPSNLMCLCPSCHAYIHNEPTESERQGWIVMGRYNHQLTPVAVSDMGRVLLTADARYVVTSWGKD